MQLWIMIFLILFNCTIMATALMKFILVFIILISLRPLLHFARKTAVIHWCGASENTRSIKYLNRKHESN